MNVEILPGTSIPCHTILAGLSLERQTESFRCVLDVTRGVVRFTKTMYTANPLKTTIE
jgi:hypothetical protein